MAAGMCGGGLGKFVIAGKSLGSGLRVVVAGERR
jgi:hypothetical protein